MTIRLTLLVDSPSRRAHGNAASRLALGFAQTGEIEPTLLCYGEDPPPSWLPAKVRVERLGVDRISRAIFPLASYLRSERPDVLVTRQVHANFGGLTASLLARTRSRWEGKLVLVQGHPIELFHAANWRDNKWLARLGYRFADGIISPSPSAVTTLSAGAVLPLSLWVLYLTRFLPSPDRSTPCRIHGCAMVSRRHSCISPI